MSFNLFKSRYVPHFDAVWINTKVYVFFFNLVTCVFTLPCSNGQCVRWHGCSKNQPSLKAFPKRSDMWSRSPQLRRLVSNIPFGFGCQEPLFFVIFVVLVTGRLVEVRSKHERNCPSWSEGLTMRFVLSCFSQTAPQENKLKLSMIWCWCLRIIWPTSNTVGSQLSRRIQQIPQCQTCVCGPREGNSWRRSCVVSWMRFSLGLSKVIV